MEAPRPPPAWSLLREGLLGLDLASVLWRAPVLLRQPRGRGEPVLVLPGFGAGDASTAPLRGYLRWLGWDARGWGLGVNRGDVSALVPQVVEGVERAAGRSGAPVRLVGWSLGGVLAREAARLRPTAVARVITLGSPAVGGPKYTTVGAVYRRRGVDVDAIEREVAALDAATPIRVPVTAIYSRGDGVVAWRACIDRTNPDVEHVRVRSTHTGLGFHGDVWAIVADRLARPPGGGRGGAGATA